MTTEYKMATSDDFDGRIFSVSSLPKFNFIDLHRNIEAVCLYPGGGLAMIKTRTMIRNYIKENKLSAKFDTHAMVDIILSKVDMGAVYTPQSFAAFVHACVTEAHDCKVLCVHQLGLPAGATVNDACTYLHEILQLTKTFVDPMNRIKLLQ